MGYIDDFHLQCDSYDECLTSVKRSVNLITRLGFVVHPDKSVLQSLHSVKVLGFILDSDTMTVRLTQEKFLELLQNVRFYFTSTMHKFSLLLESLVFLFLAFPM